jgi:RNA-directed DNA polymerase
VAKLKFREDLLTVTRPKTRLAERSTRQVVTGLVVNDGVAAPRELRRRLRAIVHNASKEGVAAQNREGRASYAAYLRGLIAFVESANPRHAQRLRADWQRALARDAGPSDGAGA